MIAPDPAHWARALSVNRGAADSRAARFRRELGLALDRSAVMSGHQPGFWHAGILAKRLACAHAARLWSASAAWVVVDHDEVDVGGLRYPAIAPDGGLSARVWRAGPPGAPGVAACAMPAFAPAWLPATADVPASARAGLERARAALERAQAGAANAARQVALAAEEVAATIDVGTAAVPPTTSRPHTHHPPHTLIHASDIARTALFGELLERMRADPHRCHEAYNAGVAAAPGAGLAALARDAARNRIELPLWRLGADGVRARVWADEFKAGANGQGGTLLPRALLLTGLMRLAGCDLFIHGTGGAGADGGGGYDRATEAWFGAWLGEALAPVATASATLLLPLLDRDPVTREEASAARSATHRARHAPGQLGEWGGQRAKHALAAQIAREVRRPVRAALYRRLHALLAEVRSAHATRLRALQERAAERAARADADALAADRTWPFVLHAGTDLADLAARVRSALEGGGA